MKRYLASRIALIFVLLALLVPVVSAWSISGDWQLPTSDTVATVSFNVGEGGLLWVNNTVAVDGDSVLVDNGTVLVFAATPTNANYSFSQFSFNDSVVFGNPYVYIVNVPENASVVEVDVLFVANSVPTPSDLTVDDSVGLAVAFGLIALVCGVGVALYLFYLKNNDEP